jgi:hypothetical protein
MIETSLIFAMGIPPAGRRQSQHLKAEDSAKTALLYMQFEIVINLKGRKCTRHCAAAKLAGAGQSDAVQRVATQARLPASSTRYDGAPLILGLCDLCA